MRGREQSGLRAPWGSVGWGCPGSRAVAAAPAAVLVAFFRMPRVTHGWHRDWRVGRSRGCHGCPPTVSSWQAEEVQQQIIRDTFHLVLKRDDHICNFLECGR